MVIHIQSPIRGGVVDQLFPIAFILLSLSLLAGALWLMWSAGSSIEKQPVMNYRTGTWTTEVVKPVHPEMKDVKPGTELMGVNFEQKTECDLEEYRALQDRIEQLRLELEEEDDDDDDGDVPALLKR